MQVRFPALKVVIKACNSRTDLRQQHILLLDPRRGALFRTTALVAAILGVYGTAQADTLTCDAACEPGSSGQYSNVIVNSGGTQKLTDTSITTALPSSQNGRAVTVTGTDATAELIRSTITLTTGTDQEYAHAFTAAVGTENGGHAHIEGGSITASGNQRTVGIQANDGGSITASDVIITTDSAFGHAVNAYSNPTTVTDTEITLSDVNISTLDDNFAVGISSANDGAQVEAVRTNIVTYGANSFGVMVFNGATVSLTDSNITTSGQNAFGIYAYTGSMSEDSATVINTDITTYGAGAIGVVANLDATVSMSGGSITTTGANSPGVVAISGGTVNMTGSSITTTGTDSSGVHLQDNSTVVLNGVTVESSGASITSQLTKANQTQNITVGSGTTMTQNNGTLLLVTREALGMDGTVNLTLGAGSTADGDVVDTEGRDALNRGETNFTVDTDASWTGELAGINNTTVAVSGSLINTGGAPIAGNVSGGLNSVIEFTNSAIIEGGVTTAAGSLASFTGSTEINGNVIGSGSTLVFNGLTTIGQNVTGSDTDFEFSRGQLTTIEGNVQLTSNSTLLGGTTATPIEISGNAIVNDGAVLGGNLTVSGALSGTGGTLSPGNSIGTQTFNTSTGFSGNFEVEVNAAGKSDRVIIQHGNIDLSGVNLIVDQESVNGIANGGFVVNKNYTILQTLDGKVSEPFKSQELGTSFANTLVNLDPVQYGAKDVSISLSVDAGKVEATREGLSNNQNQTLDGVLSVTGQNASADAALQSTDTEGALNQLSGEVHGSTQSALIASSGLLVNALSNRMRGNLDAGLVAGAPLAQASGALPASAMPQSGAHPFWAQVVGNWQTLKSDNNTARATSSTGGLVLGHDANVGNGWRVGGAMGVSNSNINVDDRSSRSEVTSYSGALYGGNSWKKGHGQVNFLAGAGFTHHDIDSYRSVTLGGNQSLQANYGANTAQLFTELGYAVPVGQASVMEPYVGATWLSQRVQGLNESGGAAALRGNSRTDDITALTLGLRGKTKVSLGRYQATLTAGGGWRRASGDINPSSTLSLVQGNSAAFSVAGAPIAKNAAVMNLGAEMSVGKSTAMGLSYSGEFGAGNRNNTGVLYLKMQY